MTGEPRYLRHFSSRTSSPPSNSPIQVQEAVTALKAVPAPSPAVATIDPDVFELRRMPRVPVKPSPENGLQVSSHVPRAQILKADARADLLQLQSKRAARIEQLLRQRGIYECEVPSAAAHSK